MEAEKSPNLWSAGWRPRRASNSSRQGPEAWDSGELMVQVPVRVCVWRQEETCVSAQRQAERVNAYCTATLLYFFCSTRAFNLLDEAHHTGEGGRPALLSLPIHMLLSSRSTLADILGITFNQTSGHPVAQSSWPIEGSPSSTWQLCASP